MTAATIQERSQQALAYLREQLGPRAPGLLVHAGTFFEPTLDGEGEVSLFSFELEPGSALDCGGRAETRYYVACGETTPNYFPDYVLTPDDAFSFHIGTRFMLEMGLQKVDESLEPPHARGALQRVLEHYAPQASAGDAALAALFRCEDQFYAVYRLRVGSGEVYCLGADCPPGFYAMTEHPPQAALRLHLGKVIRAEAQAEREQSSA